MSRARLMTRALAAGALAAAALVGTLTTVASPAEALPTVHRTVARAAALPTAEPDPEATPLSVAISSLTPATVPRRGVITISGVVANNSGEDWTDINVAPFVSATPITTRDGLAAAVRTTPSTAVGDRLRDPRTYVPVGDLASGQSAPFSIRIPRASLAASISGAPGVYWIGVHALGASAEGRDAVADGRARTFIPLVTAKRARTRTVPVSVVLPLRERARRAADGSLNGPARWVSLTGPDGRLTRLAAFGATAGSQSISWLVDPAVLDALEDFGRGNPPISLGSATRSDDHGGQPSASPSPSAAPTPLSKVPTATEQTRATSVLETFLGAARSQDVLALGYADPDAASLTRRRPSLLARAENLSRSRLATRGLAGPAVVAPPSGLFDPDLLSQVDRDTVLLLSDRGRLASPPSSRLPSGQQLVLSDERVATGGPAPTAPLDTLAVRQRLLSEAALEAESSASPRPVVLQLPVGWDPGRRWREADFFGGLQQSWIRLGPVPRDPTTTYAGQLSYGAAARAREISAANVDASRVLTRTGTVLGHLLANDNDVTAKLTGAALQSSAYSARGTPGLAADQVLALDGAMRTEMDKVQVTGTDFVTLSGDSGGILTVNLLNGLRQPITVGLRARTDSPDVKVRPHDPVSLQPGQRTTLRLDTTSRSGVHDVTIYPVTTQGEPLGTPLIFSLRTSQVSRVIWYVIIAGGLLLAVMIVRRIVLRIRLHRWRVSEEP